MASLFKPPETTRRNPKSPKLTLPPLLNHNNTTNSSSNSTNTLQLSLNMNETPKSSLLPIYSSASSISLSPSIDGPKSSTSISSNKRRPIPPPLPPSVQRVITPTTNANKTPLYRPPPEMTPTDISHALKELQITGQNSRTSPPLSAQSDHENNTLEKNKPLYQREDLNESVDSYYSTILSVYEQSNSNAASPIKSPTKHIPTITTTSIDTNLQQTITDTTTDELLMNKDVDQLDEEIWNCPNMKDQIITLGVLGEGAGGSVEKCKLKHGSKIFALKIVNTLNTDPEFQKQIFRELQFNKSFKSDYIVRYYGMFNDVNSSSIYIAMEYMSGKSLDAVYKNLLNRGGRIGEKVLGKIAESVLRGLSYLHEQKVIHRDIKPQNILFNEMGQVKLCDFGVSGEAVNSLATTFTGTSFYMAPERIQGQPYSVTCDVWSLGLTILEVAQGRFPFGSDKITANIAPIELLVLILTFSPQLKDEPESNISWSKAFKSFIHYCLKKEPHERPSPRQMIQHPWIQGQMKKKVNMAHFIEKCWEETA
ncbi:mitogen-activated protein kinase kinase MKK1 NDAI_0E01310 [Naumovozyma dairenensis CBS 421]|uniref:mitogen-activated protein kinase kinase n=1 Tax=Naumovozyma dairenensis (strain ATCC 10597 / BCRC 20456 / CBS 421 / NBRC 0211 / NRRL Y-12639) TaxID=1071378 RepID=G0WB27_NAUDC|nr:hypothetical protein NDAI_0E01310 [Naumovozyma dairenensis CBS 421]CCD24947.1 hypothetical protein NDAI_0E01310 [Naumovozyma dairenensis CBS 421]